MISKAFDFIRYINSLGYNAYIVGGYVRDTKFGIRSSHDVDIVTDCPMNLLESKFTHADISKNKSFPCEIFMYDDLKFEVSNFRGNTIVDDLKMRDFSINACAMGSDGKVIALDTLRSIYDFDNKILRVCGYDAFVQDPLRILRGCRFAAEYDLMIEPVTEFLMKSHIKLIDRLDQHRVYVELLEGCKTKNFFRYGNLLNDIGFFDMYFDEISSYYTYTQYGYAQNLSEYENFVSIFINAPEYMAKEIADFLRKKKKIPNKMVDAIVYFITNIGKFMNVDMNIYNGNMSRCDVYDMWNSKYYQMMENIMRAVSKDCAQQRADVIRDVVKTSTKYPRYALTGDDVKNITGLEGGKQLGFVLNTANRKIFEDQINPDKYRDVVMHVMEKCK